VNSAENSNAAFWIEFGRKTCKQVGCDIVKNLVPRKYLDRPSPLLEDSHLRKECRRSLTGVLFRSFGQKTLRTAWEDDGRASGSTSCKTPAWSSLPPPPRLSASLPRPTGR
jgi:hypothetical protein